MSEDQRDKIRVAFLAEENPLIMDSLATFQRFKTLELEEATSIGVAVNMIRRGRWDAIITGVNLPDDENGIDLIREIRRTNQVFPVFFYTSVNSPNLISEAFQAGANDFFVADGTKAQIEIIVEAIKVSTEIASLLQEKLRGRQRTVFEEKYEHLFDELKEGSMIVSADNGKITFINESLAGSIGHEAEELVNHDLDPLLAKRKDSISGWKDMRKQAESGSAVTQVSFRHAKGDIRTFWTQVRYLDISGKPLLLCQFRDVTRLERLEQEIYAVRNQLKVIVENSADAIVLTREDGMIEFMGGAAPRMFGITDEGRTIASLDELFGPQAAVIKKAMIQIGSRNRANAFESQINSRWGTQIPVNIAITRLPSSDKITRYLFNIMDITQQKVIEAEKLMIAELVAIMSTGVSPVEALPKLIERVYNKIPIDYGLVVKINDDEESLTVNAAYSKLQSSSIRVGQTLKREFLPAEEELWMREGLVRNNIQSQGLHPLESLLHKEGVKSYLSLPLTETGNLIGGAHFGSSKAYALNKGHLSLFREIASALTGTILQSEKGENAARFQLFAFGLADRMEYPVLLCDPEGRITYANQEAATLFASSGEVTGRIGDIIISHMFPAISRTELFRFSGKTSEIPQVSKDGEEYILTSEIIGSEKKPQGYTIIFARK